MKGFLVRARGTTWILLILTFIASLVMLEVAVRMFFPEFDPSGQVRFVRLPDGTPIGPPNVELRQTKNTGDYDVEVQFNSRGFRDDKSLAKASADDLFIVGDSFAFGWGVEQPNRFSDRLQLRLNRKIYNIAIPGTNFNDYHRLVFYVEKGGVAVKNLIVAVTMENDLGVYDLYEQAMDLTEPSTFFQSQFSLKALLAERSALYFLATRAVHQTASLRHVAIALGLLTPNFEGISDTGASDQIVTTSAFRLLQLANGRNMVVLIIPSRRLWVGEEAKRHEAAVVHEAFVGQLRASGMLVVDLRSRFEAHGTPLSYHFRRDGHWNSEGHRLAAELLAEALEKQ